MGVIERGLLFIYVVKDLEGSTTMCGAIVGVTVLTELPIFHYAGYTASPVLLPPMALTVHPPPLI